MMPLFICIVISCFLFYVSHAQELSLSPPTIPIFNNLLPISDLGNNLYNDFIKRQELLRGALFPNFLSPSAMTSISLLHPLQQQIAYVAENPSWINRLYTGSNSVGQPITYKKVTVTDSSEEKENNSVSYRGKATNEEIHKNSLNVRPLGSANRQQEVETVAGISLDHNVSVAASLTKAEEEPVDHSSESKAEKDVDNDKQLNPGGKNSTQTESLNAESSEDERKVAVVVQEVPEVSIKILDETAAKEIKNETDPEINSEEAKAERDVIKTDLDIMIKKLNLTEQQTKTFLELVDKVLERSFKQKSMDIENPIKKSYEETEEIKNSTRQQAHHGRKFQQSIDEASQTDEDDSGKSEKLREHITSNTRLTVDEEEFSRNSNSAYKTSVEADINEYHRIHATESRNYQAIEQAEYDKLIRSLKQADGNLESLSEPTDITITSTTPINLQQSEGPTKNKPTEKQNTPVPLLSTTVAVSTTKNFPLLLKLPFIKNKPFINSRRTDFAQQTYEFRNLLSSTNGIDDILKAIKHATIGFYEGPPARNVRKLG